MLGNRVLADSDRVSTLRLVSKEKQREAMEWLYVFILVDLEARVYFSAPSCSDRNKSYLIRIFAR